MDIENIEWLPCAKILNFGIIDTDLMGWIREHDLPAYDKNGERISKNLITADERDIEFKKNQALWLSVLNRVNKLQKQPIERHFLRNCQFKRDEFEKFIDDHHIDLKGSNDQVIRQKDLKKNPYVIDAIRIATVFAIRCDRDFRKSKNPMARCDAEKLFDSLKKDLDLTGNYDFPFSIIWKQLSDSFSEIRSNEAGGLVPTQKI